MIGHIGAVAVSEVIAENTVLSRIEMRNNLINIAGLIALRLVVICITTDLSHRCSHALKMNHTLTRIQVDQPHEANPYVVDDDDFTR